MMVDPKIQLFIVPEDYRRLGIAPPDIDACDRYFDMHCVCPNCRRKDSCETTCVGIIYHDDTSANQMRDTNEARCSCGWRGIVHDLLPESSHA